MQGYVLKANQRTNLGKEKCKKLRNSGVVPAVLYGAEKTPVNLIVNEHELTLLLNSIRGKFAMVDLQVEGDSALNSKILFREVQRDPVSHQLLHVDLYRLSEAKEIKVRVPIHYEGAAIGVKMGGIFEVIHREIEIKALPSKIPSYVPVDISPLDVGKAIRISDLKLGEGIEILDELDTTVAHVAIPKAVKEEEKPAEGAAATTEAAKEPELIEKKKKEDAD